MLLMDILIQVRFMPETVVAIDITFFPEYVTRWVVAPSYTGEVTPSALAFLLPCGVWF